MKNTPRQKTWTDLLGRPQGDEKVDGSFIVRAGAADTTWVVLWRFESPAAAQSAFDTWKKGWLVG